MNIQGKKSETEGLYIRSGQPGSCFFIRGGFNFSIKNSTRSTWRSGDCSDSKILLLSREGTE